MTQTTVCKFCEHCHEMPDLPRRGNADIDYRECRRYPPTVNTRAAGELDRFPRVKWYWHCHEFSPRREEDNA